MHAQMKKKTHCFAVFEQQKNRRGGGTAVTMAGG